MEVLGVKIAVIHSWILEGTYTEFMDAMLEDSVAVTRNHQT